MKSNQCHQPITDSFQQKENTRIETKVEEEEEEEEEEEKKGRNIGCCFQTKQLELEVKLTSY